MTIITKKEPILLAFGDLVILFVSLILTLALRYGSIPSGGLIELHVFAFAIIYAYSLVSFYIFGLYGRMISLARSSVPGNVLRAQIANAVVAVFLFYFVPAFEVTPKVTLFIYLALSTSFLLLWRIAATPLLSLQRRSPALLIGSGVEADELLREMKLNFRLGLDCQKQIDPNSKVEEMSDAINGNATMFQYIVADMSNPNVEALLPELYRRYFPTARVIDMHDLYEDAFNRIPLSRMNYAWIMSNVSSISPKIYDVMKRLVDITLGICVGIVCCIMYPFIALAIKLEDRGPVLVRQERLGQNNEIFHMYKFRSMNTSDSGVWLPESENKVTRVGHFLRKSRIDELPQALAIIKGDMSLIGPRADIIGLGHRLEKEIPYYTIRTVITPGLTGWAQVNQEKPPQTVEETKTRLTYDLFYIKHRSLTLDLVIALRTLRTILSREGM
jgi:lipopolysaccharide/colanic/teichoic acid biosynthesis glycosyltransferase